MPTGTGPAALISAALAGSLDDTGRDALALWLGDVGQALLARSRT